MGGDCCVHHSHVTLPSDLHFKFLPSTSFLNLLFLLLLLFLFVLLQSASSSLCIYEADDNPQSSSTYTGVWWWSWWNLNSLVFFWFLNYIVYILLRLWLPVSYISYFKLLVKQIAAATTILKITFDLTKYDWMNECVDAMYHVDVDGRSIIGARSFLRR